MAAKAPFRVPTASRSLAAAYRLRSSGERPRAGRQLCPHRARADRPDPGRFRGAHRRAGRDGAQLGAGQAVSPRTSPRVAQGAGAGSRGRVCGARQGALIDALNASRRTSHSRISSAASRIGAGIAAGNGRCLRHARGAKGGCVGAQEPGTLDAVIESHGARIPGYRVRHHDAQGGFVRRSGRGGAAARLPPSRHGADVRQ